MPGEAAGLAKLWLIKVFEQANLPTVNSLSIDPHDGFVYSRIISFNSSLFCSDSLQLARKADKAHFVSDKIQIEYTVEEKLNSFHKKPSTDFQIWEE